MTSCCRRKRDKISPILPIPPAPPLSPIKTKNNNFTEPKLYEAMFNEMIELFEDRLDELKVK